jgi:biotin-dependent enzyme
MSDEPSDDGGLPVLSSRQQGLSLQKNSLVKRGLDLVAATSARSLRAERTTSCQADPLVAARTELAAARHFLDLAGRLSSDPTDWDVFARHCRDAYRHALRALATHVHLVFIEPVECAERLLLISGEDCPGLSRGILARGVPEWLPDVVSYFERLVETIEPDRPEAHRWEALDGGHQVILFVLQQLFVEDVAELIGRGVLSDGQISVVIPSVGEGVTEGTIVRWFKMAGDVIDRDETLFQVSTDKVNAEIRSPAAGRLAAIYFDEGETVAVNELVAIIDKK